MTDISIIICTYNRAEILDDTLYSLSRVKDINASGIEILVVDNNSTDHSRDIVERWINSSEFNIRYLFEKQQGTSHARNLAIASAEGNWLWFVDDDIYFDEGWLTGVHKAIDCFPEVASIAGRIFPTLEKETPDWMLDVAYDYYGRTDYGNHSRLLTENEYPVAANAGFHRDTFSKVGSFQARLGRYKNNLISWDETELAIRIRKMHGQIAYAHDALVHHRVTAKRMTKWWLYRRLFADGISECRSNNLNDDDKVLNNFQIFKQNIRSICMKACRLEFSLEDRLNMCRKLGLANESLKYSLKSLFNNYEKSK